MEPIEKAINLTSLRKDLETLVGQANAISGALQYVKSKIAELEKPTEEVADART